MTPAQKTIRVRRWPFFTGERVKLWYRVVARDGMPLGYPQPRAILARNWLTPEERRLALR